MSDPIIDEASYDVLVVGGGTAGCLLATRLAERGHDVALIEWGRTTSTSLGLGTYGGGTKCSRASMTSTTVRDPMNEATRRFA